MAGVGGGASVAVFARPRDDEVVAAVCLALVRGRRAEVGGARVVVVAGALVDLAVAVVVGAVADLGLRWRRDAVREPVFCAFSQAAALADDLATGVFDLLVAERRELLRHRRGAAGAGAAFAAGGRGRAHALFGLRAFDAGRKRAGVVWRAVGF